METIRVLLVDDHSVVRRGVSLYLAMHKDIEIVAEANSGDEGVSLAEEKLPDVVLMDLIMPKGIDGVEATRRIKGSTPTTQVVVLTSYHDDEHIFPAIRAGALSYVLKDIDAEELVDVVRKAARGEATIHPRVAQRMMAELSGGTGENPYLLLTDRELEVLQLLAMGVTTADLADRLCISHKTVRTHVSNILSKLHLKDRTQAAVYAWKQGLVRRD